MSQSQTIVIQKSLSFSRKFLQKWLETSEAGISQTVEHFHGQHERVYFFALGGNQFSTRNLDYDAFAWELCKRGL